MHYVNATESYVGLQKTLLASCLNGLLYGTLIMGLELGIFGAVSLALTRFENYRTQSEFESSYVFKMFFFIWVDGYLWYWLLGLVHIPLIRYYAQSDGSISEDLVSRMTFFGVKLFTGSTTVEEWVLSFESAVTFQTMATNFGMLAIENLLPVLGVWASRRRWLRHLRAARKRASWPLLREALLGDRRDERLWATVEQVRQVLWEGNREPYDTFWDLYDTVLYLGYTSVLPLLFPPTPLLILLNNMLEVRTDIAKVGTCQRPVPRAAADLGEWEKCLWFQNYAAVLQVALFTTLSTETLEKVWFTDPTNRYYFVDGKLTLSVRLAVAFGFGAAMYLGIFIIRSLMGGEPEAEADERRRARARRARHERLRDERQCVRVCT